MDLNALKLLVEIVEAGNLSAAARRLNTTRSNVSHRLKAFEQAVGVQLLRRTTRRIEPTQVGYALYEHGSKIVREMEAANAAVATLGKSLSGHVRISIPTMLGQMALGGLLIEFAQSYPDISLRVVYSNRIVDLVASEIDVALRITSDPPESYVARELARIDWVLCAAPLYVQDRGLPQEPPQLFGHTFVTTAVESGKFALKLQRAGKEHVVQVLSHIQSENFLFLKDAILAGVGLGILPLYAVRDELADGRLLAAMPDYTVEGLGNRLYLITAPNLYPTQAARTLIEYLKSRVEIHTDSRRAS